MARRSVQGGFVSRGSMVQVRPSIAVWPVADLLRKEELVQPEAAEASRRVRNCCQSREAAAGFKYAAPSGAVIDINTKTQRLRAGLFSYAAARLHFAFKKFMNAFDHTSHIGIREEGVHRQA